ncbi:MAG: outer membrane beta-barrel protein [Bauldia sp.]
MASPSAGIRADLHDSYARAGRHQFLQFQHGWGWTVGAGVAAALSDHWTVKAEYLYADLGSRQYTFVEPTGPEWSKITNSARTTASIGRVAIDYRF